MRIDQDCMSLWFATSDAPAPEGTVADGANISLTVAVQPPDASNQVKVLYRLDGGPVQALPANWFRNDIVRKAQYFRAQFPTLRAGDKVEYSAICHCAGRQIPSAADAERLASSFRIAGGEKPALRPALRQATLVARPVAQVAPRISSVPPVPINPLSITIDQPQPLVTGKSPVLIDMRGKLHFKYKPLDLRLNDISVDVSVDDGNAFKPAILTDRVQRDDGYHAAWSFSTSVNESSKLSLVARAHANWTVLNSPVYVPPVDTWADARRTVLVIVDDTPPTLTINIPTDKQDFEGSGPQYTIKVDATASDTDTGVKTVEVQVDGGPFSKSRLRSVGHTLLWTQDMQVGYSDQLQTITVRATDSVGNFVTKPVSIKTIDTAAPTLKIEKPDPLPSTPQWPGQAVMEISGTASDPTTGVHHVQWRLNQGQSAGKFVNAENVSGVSSPWSQWRATINFPSPDTYEIEVRARDHAGKAGGNYATIKKIVVFVEALKFKEISLNAYLQDLLTFAEQRARVSAKKNAQHLDVAKLTQAFYQPFDRLRKPETEQVAEIAMRPVHQVRLCIEVLRRFLGGTAAVAEGAESEYRRLAYQTLLRNLGTSYEELRLARVADEASRQSLAERLGMELNSPRPDHLDELFLAPDRLETAQSEADLEALFGLVNTQRDPLATGFLPKLAIWRADRLRTLWRQQDQSDDVPILDPDLIGESDLMPINAVHELWVQRRQWVALVRENIRKQRESKNKPLAGFASIVKSILQLSQPELEALEDERENGNDIAPRLEEHHLGLQPFLFLVRFRRLAATGTVLEVEWDDVYDILVQVQKRRDKYAEWRQEEQASGLTLSADYFQSPDSTSPVSEQQLPRWRTTWQARRRWERILAARIKQDRAMRESLEAAVAACEEATLPLLRTVLVNTISPGESEAEIADWLTKRLLIDFASGVKQKTTRIHQAIETLQGALFSLRTERLKVLNPRFGQQIPFAQWRLDTNGYTESDFDKEWSWMGAYSTWSAAMFVFAYPENYLLPTLRKKGPFDEDTKHLQPTDAFWKFVDRLRDTLQLTPTGARDIAQDYLVKAAEELGDNFSNFLLFLQITEQMSAEQLSARRNDIKSIFDNSKILDPYDLSSVLKEILLFVPLQIALKLQKSGEYQAALDWFQTVYAYNLAKGDVPAEDNRKIYFGLELEENIETTFSRPPSWLTDPDGLNPHEIVGRLSRRANAYTRFTLMSIIGCFLDFADAEFTRATMESVPNARALYLAALDLLDELQNTEPPRKGDKGFPPNPLPISLRVHAEINLLKLRTNRNIAGMERPAVPESAVSAAAAPLIDSNGQIVLPTTATPQPTPYRYTALIARAKELVNIAQQMEAAFLATLEKRDAEEYTLLQAGHHLELAKATVELQSRRVEEAAHGETLATLQRDRAETQSDTYEKWIDAGRNDYEDKLLDSFRVIESQRNWLARADATLAVAQAASGGGLFGISGPWGVAAATGAVAAAAAGRLFAQESLNEAERESQVFAFEASHERQVDEWILQKSLAGKDIDIAQEQIFAAKDQKRVVEQEKVIADTEVKHARSAVDFLGNKKMNVQLYDWMSGVLQRVYGYFLRQASAVAQLAQSQLAFERQEMPPALILADYWQPPAENAVVPGAEGQTPDRRGLTGSARLLQDIYRLDQHAFETRKRMLQLSQTFSLARLTPFEFQLFRESGIIPFVTPMELFDRGFPGHYLRLMKRVRLSVVALIPPNQGIRATLTAAGISRVVIASDVFQNSFQTMEVRRQPELIAFTSPVNATGLLELEPEGELLLPFEGMGVETSWQLEMPKAANPFDYRTIADVLVTIEYTALHSATYREQVIRQLDRSISADRSFSFRNEFPDAFYDLNNPDQVETPMVARFETRREDFPPNIDELAIDQLLLFFAPADEDDVEVSVDQFFFTERRGATNGVAPVGGGATTSGGVISTRRGNGAAWQPILGRLPVGTWELALADTEDMRSLLTSGKIEDILFVITYSGQTPAWPS